MRLGLAFFAAVLLAAPPAPARAADLNVITAVEVRSEGGTILVNIQGSRPPNFTTFSMMDPPRFVIDLSESQFKGVPEDVAVGDDTINVVKNLSYGSAETSIARVMIAFNREVDPPDVQSNGNALVVRVARAAGGASVARAAPPAPAVDAAAAQAAADAQLQAQAAAKAEADAKARAELEARQAELESRNRIEAEERAKAEEDARLAAASKAAARGTAATAEGAAAAGGALAGAGAAAAEPPRTPEPLAAERARQDKENEELLAWKEAQKKAEAEAARRKEEEARVQVTRLDELNRQKAEAEARAREEQAARDRAADEARARVARARETATVPAPVTPVPAVASPEEQARAENAAAEAQARAEREARAREQVAQAPVPAAAPVAAPEPAPATSAPAPAPAPEPARERLAMVEPAPAAPHRERLVAPGKPRQVREIGFQQSSESSRVFVRLSDSPTFQISEVGDNVIELELANTRAVRRNDTRLLDTSFFASAVAMVTPRRQGSSYVVEIRLKEKVPYQQKVEGDMLAIDFERPAGMRGGPPAAEPAVPGARPSGEAPAETQAPEAPQAPADPPAPGR